MSEAWQVGAQDGAVSVLEWKACLFVCAESQGPPKIRHLRQTSGPDRAGTAAAVPEVGHKNEFGMRIDLQSTTGAHIGRDGHCDPGQH